MIFIDSNIPMYLMGAAHPHKEGSRRALERLIGESARLVTDVEVIQEILHRYGAIGRRDAITPCVDTLQALADEIFSIDVEDVLRARDHMGSSSSISARDAIHVAVMHRYGVETILSFDSGFDGIPGVRRITA